MWDQSIVKQPIKIAFSLLLMFVSFVGHAEKPPIDTANELKKRLSDIHGSTGSTALAFVIIDQGQIVLQGAMGAADAEKSIDANENTLFPMASISKMVVALSVLKLVDEKQLSLDTPLRDIAPEVVQNNQWRKAAPVRLVHLLEQTTGWRDLYYREYAHNQTTTITLREALEQYPEARRSRWVPGTRMAYSNQNAAVAAYVVEKVSGMSFETYAKEMIFEPLQMSTARYLPSQKSAETVAMPHEKGEPLPYRKALYPPTSALKASPNDMAQLLQVFLRRGGASNHELLPAALVHRMETPSTTLANPFGVTAGYGLANRTDGTEHHGVTFHGHGGGLYGAMAILNYAPDLNSGYVLALTGNPAGAKAMKEAVHSYLLRDYQAAPIPKTPLPDHFSSIGGIYAPLNLAVDTMRFTPEFFRAIRVTPKAHSLERQPLVGGEMMTSYARWPDDMTLTERSTGRPSIARVTDPLAGSTLQVGSGLYKKTPALLVWAELALWAALLLLSALALLHALIWLPLNIHRKTLNKPVVAVRSWSTIASALFLAAILYPLLVPIRIDQITPSATASNFFLIITLAYAAASALGLITVIRRRSEIRQCRLWGSLPLILLHALMTIYLTTQGVIGMRLWTW